MGSQSVSVVGGAGFIGANVTRRLLEAGYAVTSIDRAEQPELRGATMQCCDVLLEPAALPNGDVVLALGGSNPRPTRPWELAVGNILATARLLPQLVGRQVLLLSSVEVYGSAEGLLTEDTSPDLPAMDRLNEWIEEALVLSKSPCPSHRVASYGRTVAAADPTGRWIYALTKLAQEQLLRAAVPAESLTILRLANVVGAGQERLVTRLIRRAWAGLPLRLTAGVRRSFTPIGAVADLAVSKPGAGTFNVGAEPLELTKVAELVQLTCAANVPIHLVRNTEADSSGLVSAARLATAGYRVPELAEYLPALVAELADPCRKLFVPNLSVVVPPRPENPDIVVDRQQRALNTGLIKHGNRWTSELHEQLGRKLALPRDHSVISTVSGTAALRLAVAAVAGRATPGVVAILPSFTFAATAEVLLQLGYSLRYADIDPVTWTIDPDRLPALLMDGDVGVVVAVDTFGLACDYSRLRQVCNAAGVPLVADSAASLGSLHHGQPVAALADGHAYSMSFAKVLSAGGAGGALVLPRETMDRLVSDINGWTRSELMTEMHATVVLDQLPLVEPMTVQRGRIAAIYADAISGNAALGAQQPRAGDRHSFVHWVFRTPHRDIVQKRLLQLGIETKPYFTALHYRIKAARPCNDDLAVTERLDAEALALPMSSEMSEAEGELVAFGLSRVLRSNLVDDGQ
jgi:dTDP-4-amino-4,6-dideoxygalactose transaminase/nucleoside-diphosphate-sugar epimerase